MIGVDRLDNVLAECKFLIGFSLGIATGLTGNDRIQVSGRRSRQSANGSLMYSWMVLSAASV